MERIFVRHLLFAALVSISVCSVSGVRYIDESSRFVESAVQQASTATTRALKSIQKLSEDFSGDVETDSVLTSHQRRRLLVTERDDGFCDWEDGKCKVSGPKTLELTSSAAFDMTRFIVHSDICEMVTTERLCCDIGCAWERGLCVPPEKMPLPQSLRKCMGDLQLAVESISFERNCMTQYSTNDTCITGDKCIWDAEVGVCGFDEFGALTDVLPVDGLPMGYNEVSEGFIEWFKAKLVEDGIDATNDPNVVRAWKPAPYVCPDESKRLACDMVAAMLEDLIAAELCEKISGFAPMSCNADPLCEIKQGECVPSQAVKDRQTRRTNLAIAASTNDAVIGRILVPVVTCRRKSMADCMGNCAWAGALGQCVPNGMSVAGDLAALSRLADGAICDILASVLNSGCVALTADECVSTPGCQFTAGGFCAPEASFVDESIVMGNESVQSAYRKLGNQCSRRKTEMECT